MGAAKSEYKAGRFTQVLASLSEMLKLAPGNVEALTLRAGAYAKLGDWERAAREAQTAARADPSHAPAYMRQSAILLKLERYGEAEAAASAGLRRSHENTALQQLQRKARESRVSPPNVGHGPSAGADSAGPSGAARRGGGVSGWDVSADAFASAFSTEMSGRGEGCLLPAAEVVNLLRDVVQANEVETLSMVLNLDGLGPKPEALDDRCTELLRLAMKSDAAECAMYLLNRCEEHRRARQESASKRLRPVDKHTRDQYASTTFAQRQEARVEMREFFREERERHCGAAPNSLKLLALAREALFECDPPARRVGIALLLQAHRLRCRVPMVGCHLLGCDDLPLKDSNGVPGVCWPAPPLDLPAELRGAGIGGVDLSCGGEAVPLQWVNEVDEQLPPPMLFTRRCIDADIWPNWEKIPKGCSTSQQTRDFRVDRCSNVFFTGKPDGSHCECASRSRFI